MVVQPLKSFFGQHLLLNPLAGDALYQGSVV